MLENTTTLADAGRNSADWATPSGREKHLSSDWRRIVYKIERKGFILLPSMEGYKLFEINEDRLKLYLEAESVYKHSESIINKQTDCPAEFIEIVDKEFWNLI